MRLWSAKRSSVLPSTDEARGPDSWACGDGPWAGLQYKPGEKRGHVESWFLKANDSQQDRALWLKWTLWAGDRAPEQAVAEAWAVAFGTAQGHVATKVAVPYARASFARGGLFAAIDECTLLPRAARGRVDSGGRSIAYDLTFESRGEPLQLYAPRWMYTGPVPTQKLASPIPDARVSGQLVVDGQTWDLRDWPGMVGHNWGRHSETYAWGHCNAWDDGSAVVLEGVTGRTKIAGVGRGLAGGVSLPPRTVLVVRDGGATYAMNDLRSVVRNGGGITARRWQFRAVRPGATVEGEMWAETDDFVGVFYTNPDGAQLHCLNSKIAHAEVTLTLQGRAPRTLRSRRAALEILTPDRHHGVRMYV